MYGGHYLQSHRRASNNAQPPCLIDFLITVYVVIHVFVIHAR